MRRAVRCILVTPGWCLTPLTGGGQRTGLFYAALQRIGPVELVVVGHGLDREQITAAFPDAAGLHLVETDRVPHRPMRGLELQFDRFRRYFRFARDYRPDANLRDTVRAVARAASGSGRTLVLYRYFPTFCWAGHSTDDPGAADRVLCVDIDDRDDQRLLLSLQKAIRNPAFVAIYRRLIPGFLRRLMRRRLAPAALIWFAAGEDAAGFRGLPVEVIPNVPFAAPEGPVAAPSSRRDLLFVGTEGFAPNRDAVRWFLESCWPAILARHPDSRLRVVGSGNWARFARTLAEEVPDLTAGVDVIGRVEDLAAEYDRARLVIAPIFVGGGSKIKVIEACAHGRPVVVTSHSARGFGPEIEALLPQSDMPEGYTAACLRLLDDGAEADALGARLQALQQAMFSRNAIEDRIEAQLRAAVDR